MPWNKTPLEKTPDGGLRLFDEDEPLESCGVRALAVAKADLSAWFSRLQAVVAGRASKVMTEKERAQLAAAKQLGAKIDLAYSAAAASDAANLAAPDPGSAAADAYFSRLAAQKAGLIPGGDGTPGSRHMAWRRGTPFFGAAAAADLGGFATSRDFMWSVAHGLSHPAMRADSQSGNQGSAGGFAIPTQTWNRILMNAVEDTIVASRSQGFPMASRELDIPLWDDLDRTDGAIAGLSLTMASEGGAVDQQVAKLRMMTLRARKGMILVSAPNELLADAVAFEGGLERLLITALSFGWDHRFLLGDGSNGPLGCLVAPCTITINRNTANKIIYDDVLSMFSRVPAASIPDSVWIANSTCIPELAKLSLPVGTGGSAIPVMTESAGRFVILTRPVLFTEKVPALGTKSDLSLCSFGSYAWGARQNAALEKSIHIGFSTDEQMFRLVARFDGQPTLSSAITPMNGSTLSPFVTLGDPA